MRIPHTAPALLLILAMAAASCQCTPRGTVSPPGSRGKQTVALDDTILRDIGNASKIVIDNDLVLNLTHLQRMNDGGRKYYILEKETISYLLSSVTRNIYSDIILVNREGIVVYTMRDDGIFAKNVREMVPPSPLLGPFAGGMAGKITVEKYPGMPGGTGVSRAIASPLVKNAETSGVIIFVTDTGVREEKLARKTD